MRRLLSSLRTVRCADRSALRVGFQKTNIPFAEEHYKFTKNIYFRTSADIFDSYRVIDLKGEVVAPGEDVKVPQDIAVKIYETMIRLEEMDTILLKTQRQGQISFYMTSHGEGACVLGTAAALKFEDLIYPQYREQGLFLWRGWGFKDFVLNCASVHGDKGKGRQMPVHYGSSAHNIMTVSSPLCTQVPQASGSGYAFRVAGQDRVSVTFFGEGAASEGDFHSALNFAATLKCQTLFLCRNNKYAISTPSIEQYGGDGIAGRGIAYGIATLRVDGNDALACYNAVKAAREYIVRERRPALIEFMTYRIGDHSTSDHSVLYRDDQEIKSWTTQNHPITRLGLYLKNKGLIEANKEKDDAIRAKYREEIIRELKEALSGKKASIEELFVDVYDKLTPNLVEQKQQLEEHLKVYGAEYHLEKYHKN
eukprot:TRINITY_DN2203_c0_g1_i4.p1 TRINITY_DN2203_c0_g1~~TRINITY_DN2203_c0_g1_i4.p1  ORF type:complete len:423 (-),score=118.66 TRINITY_DN2203_c0_g1_i4:89-1357(-)